MNWRINYGNGQVHEVASRKEAVRLLHSIDGNGHCRVQRRGDAPDGWITVKLTRGEQDFVAVR